MKARKWQRWRRVIAPPRVVVQSSREALRSSARRVAVFRAVPFPLLAEREDESSVVVVGNKVRSSNDEEFLKTHMAGFEFLGFLPYDTALIEADLKGVSPFDVDSPSKARLKEMIPRL